MVTAAARTLQPPIADRSPANAPAEGSRSPGVVEVNVQTAGELDEALENAINEVTEAALHHGTGIMVTRTGEGRYIVRAHPAVPYGLIRQRHTTE